MCEYQYVYMLASCSDFEWKLRLPVSSVISIVWWICEYMFVLSPNVIDVIGNNNTVSSGFVSQNFRVYLHV